MPGCVYFAKYVQLLVKLSEREKIDKDFEKTIFFSNFTPSQSEAVNAQQSHLNDVMPTQGATVPKTVLLIVSAHKSSSNG